MSTPPSAVPPIKNSSLAISSLGLGIFSLVSAVCIGPLFAIPAIICGHIALVRVKRSGGSLGGRGIAMAGLITGYVGIALTTAIFLPNFVGARESAQRNTCINNLRIIDGAKQKWAFDNNKTAEDFPRPQDLDKYLPAGFNSLHCPAGGVYTINKDSAPPTCSVPRHQLP